MYQQELFSDTGDITLIAANSEVQDVGAYDIENLLLCHYKRENATELLPCVCYEECK